MGSIKIRYRQRVEKTRVAMPNTREFSRGAPEFHGESVLSCKRDDFFFNLSKKLYPIMIVVSIHKKGLLVNIIQTISIVVTCDTVQTVPIVVSRTTTTQTYFHPKKKETKNH
jgi:hypothetical protein